MLRVLVVPELAELALPPLGVVHAVLADAAAHVARGRVHVGVEEAGVGVVVAVALWIVMNIVVTNHSTL